MCGTKHVEPRTVVGMFVAAFHLAARCGYWWMKLVLVGFNRLEEVCYVLWNAAVEVRLHGDREDLCQRPGRAGGVDASVQLGLLGSLQDYLYPSGVDACTCQRTLLTKHEKPQVRAIMEELSDELSEAWCLPLLLLDARAIIESMKWHICGCFLSVQRQELHFPQLAGELLPFHQARKYTVSSQSWRQCADESHCLGHRASVITVRVRACRRGSSMTLAGSTKFVHTECRRGHA